MLLLKSHSKISLGSVIVSLYSLVGLHLPHSVSFEAFTDCLEKLFCVLLCYKIIL